MAGWRSTARRNFRNLLQIMSLHLESKFSNPNFGLRFDIARIRHARYFSPFIVIVGDIFVAEPSGEIALRIKQVKSGVLPIPFARFVEGLSDHVQQNGVDVAWTEFDGDPVALISIPPEHLRLGDRLVRVDSVICADQQVELVGKSTEFKPATN